MKYFLTISILFFTTIIFAQVSTDFNNGLEYWTIEGDSDYQWSATGGNPAGCLVVDDYAVGDINKAYAPFKFLGDWSSADTTDYISMNIYLNTFEVIYIEDINYVFEISGPGGDAWAIENPYPSNHSWTTYSITLNPANWHIERGSWEALMEDVQSFSVTVEYIEGDETDKLDNVYLSFTPTIHPVQIGTISDFEHPGFDGWSFKNVSGVTNELSGGNPHRYISVNGESNFTVGVAASKFTGSWQLLENNAAIMVDLKKLSSNVDFQTPPYLFKIINDSSSAIYPCPSNINLRYNQWITVSAMIQESDWTVLSGSWDNLMSCVSELKVALDFYQTQSNIGMDNFRVNDEPPEVHFTVDKREVYLGTQIHFTDLSTNSPESWLWNFGDNSTSTTQNPFHLYQAPGKYDVSLTATNMFGSNQLTKTDYITIYDPNEDFHDDFDDGRINDLWTLIRGNWREENGFLQQTSNTGSGEELNDGCFAIVGSENWTNYEVRANFINPDNEGVGLVLNFQDENNFYLFQWDSNNYQQAAIYIFENGQKTLLTSQPITYDSNTAYNISFSNIFGKLTVIIDGNTVLTYQSRELTEGKCGLWCSGSNGVKYDSFDALFLPNAPSNVELSRSGSNVTLQWNAVHNAVYYNIYSSDDDEHFVLEVEGIPTTSWTGTISADKKFFRITANK